MKVNLFKRVKEIDKSLGSSNEKEKVIITYKEEYDRRFVELLENRARQDISKKSQLYGLKAIVYIGDGALHPSIRDILEENSVKIFYDKKGIEIPGYNKVKLSYYDRNGSWKMTGDDRLTFETTRRGPFMFIFDYEIYRRNYDGNKFFDFIERVVHGGVYDILYYRLKGDKVIVGNEFFHLYDQEFIFNKDSRRNVIRWDDYNILNCKRMYEVLDINLDTADILGMVEKYEEVKKILDFLTK